MKATLVLLPLLGITYMLFFVNPGEDEISQIVFIYFNSFLESFQVTQWKRLIAKPFLLWWGSSVSFFFLWCLVEGLLESFGNL